MLWELQKEALMTDWRYLERLRGYENVISGRT